MIWYWRRADPRLLRPPTRAPNGQRCPRPTRRSGCWNAQSSRRSNGRARPQSRRGRSTARPSKPARAFSAGARSPRSSACCSWPWPGARDTSIWNDAAHFESTDDAFIAARQFSDCAAGGGLYHRGSGHRQRACRRRPGDRPHRRSRLTASRSNRPRRRSPPPKPASATSTRRWTCSRRRSTPTRRR